MEEVDEQEFHARTKNGAVLVEFGAEWCAPCKAMQPILARISSDYAGKLDVVAVDIDKSQNLAMRHGVMSVPTIVLFNGGKAVDRIVGAVSEKELKKRIDHHVAGG